MSHTGFPLKRNHCTFEPSLMQIKQKCTFSSISIHLHYTNIRVQIVDTGCRWKDIKYFRAKHLASKIRHKLMAVKSKLISKPLLKSQVIRFMALVSPSSATETYDVQECGKVNLKNCWVDVSTQCVISTAFFYDSPQHI